MKITLTPKDLIERCLWANYHYYVLKNMPVASVNALIEKNELFSIDEKDAFVIGLLKVIHTDNLVHKFNQHIKAIIEAKSFPTPATNKRLIGRDVLVNGIDKFMKSFPESYKPNTKWRNEMDKVVKYIDDLKKKIWELEVVIIQELACINSLSVLKLLNEHHG